MNCVGSVARSAFSVKSERFSQKPRPGLHGRPIRSRPRIRVLIPVNCRLLSKKYTGQPLRVCFLSMIVHFAGQFLAWFAVLAVLMSFLEHQIHRSLMHRANFLSSRLLFFNKMFEHHAILHHGQYSKVFDDKPVAAGEDRHLRLSIREGFLEALPIAALLAVISLEGAIIFEIVVCLHHFIWNKRHLEMHKPEKRFLSDWPVYKFLARHHYLHHKHRDKNFNVVLPLADYVLGTNIRASNSELNEMYRLRLL